MLQGQGHTRYTASPPERGLLGGRLSWGGAGSAAGKPLTQSHCAGAHRGGAEALRKNSGRREAAGEAVFSSGHRVFSVVILASIC